MMLCGTYKLDKGIRLFSLTLQLDLTSVDEKGSRSARALIDTTTNCRSSSPPTGRRESTLNILVSMDTQS
jgi:hypothetical protein